jgi:hypothetical protein
MFRRNIIPNSSNANEVYAYMHLEQCFCNGNGRAAAIKYQRWYQVVEFNSEIHFRIHKQLEGEWFLPTSECRKRATTARRIPCFRCSAAKTHVHVNAEFPRKLLLYRQKYGRFNMFTVFIHVTSKEKEIFYRQFAPAVYNIWNGCNSGYMFCPLLCS